MATENPITTYNGVARLAVEFRSNILKLGSKSLPNLCTASTSMTTDTNSSSSYGLPPQQDYIEMTHPTTIETVNHLRRIATAMSSAGCLDDCIQIYASEKSRRFKIQKLSQREFRKFDREKMSSEIHDWNRSAHICMRFMVEEKGLCAQIFHSLGNGSRAVDDCIIKTFKEPVSLLFDNAETLCSVHLSQDIFGILDLYDTLSRFSGLDLFSSESWKFIRLRPAQLLAKAAQLIRHILSDFERDVLLEKSPTLLPVPVIHRHTVYVLSFFADLCGCGYNSMQTLMTLIQSKPDSAGVLEYDERRTPLSLHLIWILMQLLSNLEAKSKHYKQASMPEFFILINVDYIVGKIKESPELQVLIGDRYLMKLTFKLGQAKADYLDLVLDKLLHCLQAEGQGRNGMSGMFSSKAKRMTKRLKIFNDRFAKAQCELAKLVIPDLLLLVDIRKSISEKLIPAYSSFLEELKNVTGGEGKPSREKHIKYTAKELKTAVHGLYKCY